MIWYSGLSKNLKTKLQIVQNKLIRFILALPSRAHVGYEEFSKTRMFPVHKRVDQLKMNHVFNIMQGLSPVYLREDILLNDQTRSVTKSFMSNS